MPEDGTVEDWLEKIDELTYEPLAAQLLRMDGPRKDALAHALCIYKDKQADSASERQEGREKRLVEIADEANEIAKRSGIKSNIALLIAAISLIVSIVALFVKNS